MQSIPITKREMRSQMKSDVTKERKGKDEEQATRREHTQGKSSKA